MTENSPRPVAFVNTPIDFLLIGGLSMVHFVILYVYTKYAPPHYMPANLYLSPVTWASAAGFLVWVINYPHFAATSYRLYQSKENIRQFPITALGVPVLVVALIGASLHQPGIIAPWFAKLMLFWSMYHYSGQTMGITLLYTRRAGIALENITRNFLSFFIMMMFVVSTTHYNPHIQRYYYSIPLPNFGLPMEVWYVARVVVNVLGIIAFALLWRDCRKQGKKPPLLMFIPAASLFLWSSIGRHLPGFNELVPAYHSMQYLIIAWAMQLKTRLDTGAMTPSRFFVTKESIRWGIANGIIGAFLFSWLPWLVQQATNNNFPTVIGIVIAGVQIHHFFVDGVIWKLRNPKVGQPLMTNMDDLTGKALA